MAFVLFAILGISILFSLHYFIYFSFVKFFSISSTAGKITLATILFIFAASFFISSFLTHYYKEHNPARVYYFVSSAWLGIGLNIILALLATWIIYGICRLIGLNLNIASLAIFFLFLSFTYSAYGFWNAMNPQIKKISVEIKNLPEEWKGKTIVQLSDLHLGNIHREKFLQKVIDETNKLNPDMIAITGDLFDGMDGDLNIFIPQLNRLNAPLGIFFTIGNHETYLGKPEAFSILNKTKIKPLRNEMIVINGLQIIGVDYEEPDKPKKVGETIKSLSGYNPEKSSILLYHAPIQIPQIKSSGINLQLSGHSHDGQIFPIKYISKLIYGKYTYGLYKESDFTIYTTSGAGTWGPMMRTSSKPEIILIELN